MRGRALAVLLVVLAVMCFLALAWAGMKHAWRDTLDTVGWGMSWYEISRDSKTFDLAGAKTIVIENRFGDVEVLPGGPGVAVQTIIRAQGKDLADARRRARDARLVGAAGPMGVFRIVGLPDGADHHVRMNLTVYAPPEVAIDVKATAGGMTVTDRQAPVSLDACAGDVEVTGCGGPVKVSALAGSVRITSAHAGATVNSKAGDIRIDGAQGPLSIDSRAGQAILQGIRSDQVNVSVACGDIRIEFAEPFSGTLTADSSAGNITIAVPRGSRARVITDATVGTIQDDLTSDVLAREGPGLIEARTSAGSITLEEASPSSPD